MRILIVSNLFPPFYLGGYEILAEQVSRDLAAKGHDVHVLSSMHGVGKGCLEKSRDGIKSIDRSLALEVPFDKPFRLNRQRRLKQTRINSALTASAIKRTEPDLIFYWSQLRLTVGPMQAGKASRVPCVYTFNDENIRSYVAMPQNVSGLRRMARLILDGALYRRATLEGIDFTNSMVISDYTKGHLINHGVPVKNAKIVYQGIPIEQFPSKETPGLLHDPVRVLYVGQIHDYKGVPEIIEAFDVHLSRMIPEGRATLTLAGTGPETLMDALKEQSKGCPFPIKWLGKVPYEELPELYRTHDILLFPSKTEAFGLTFLEGMASGLPVIATTAGGHSEVLHEGENALLIRSGDSLHLAERLAELIQDPELAKKLAIEGRRMVRDGFTIRRYLDEIEAFLLEAVDR